MRAGAFLGDGRVGVIELEEPGPPGAGQVQLDVAYCGVCGSDLHMVEYGYFPPEAVPGHLLSRPPYQRDRRSSTCFALPWERSISPVPTIRTPAARPT
jgi:hypothetical protein